MLDKYPCNIWKRKILFSSQMTALRKLHLEHYTTSLIEKLKFRAIKRKPPLFSFGIRFQSFSIAPYKTTTEENHGFPLVSEDVPGLKSWMKGNQVIRDLHAVFSAFYFAWLSYVG